MPGFERRPDMRADLPRIAPALLLAGITTAPAGAESIYRCMQNGVPAFSRNAADPSCQPIDVNPYEPDPEATARQKEELRKWRDGRSQALAEGRRKKTGGKKSRAGPLPGTGNQSSAGSAAVLPKLPNELDFQDPPPYPE